MHYVSTEVQPGNNYTATSGAVSSLRTSNEYGWGWSRGPISWEAWVKVQEQRWSKIKVPAKSSLVLRSGSLKAKSDQKGLSDLQNTGMGSVKSTYRKAGPNICACAHTHTHRHTHSHTCTHSHIHILTHTHRHTSIHTYYLTHIFTHTHTGTHTLIYIYSLTHTYNHRHTLSHTHSLSHTHTDRFKSAEKKSLGKNAPHTLQKFDKSKRKWNFHTNRQKEL